MWRDGQADEVDYIEDGKDVAASYELLRGGVLHHQISPPMTRTLTGSTTWW